MVQTFRRPARVVPRPSKAKPKPEPDLKLLADAANEAAKREAAQWLYFVTVMLPLAAIVGSTTHRVLFLEDPVKVPILSVELPLRGFYVAAPAIFVVLHFYLLAQLRLMTAKVRTFLDAVKEAGLEAAARDRELNRLDTFSVAQLVVADRYSRIAPTVRAMVWVTLVVAPALLLLFFQLRFLPFHSEGITWWHRGLLAVDLVLVWGLWPPLESVSRVRRAIHAARGVVAAPVLAFAVLIATIPDEASDIGGGSFPLRAALFGDLSWRDIGVDQQPRTLFARRLILPDQDFVPEDDKARAEMRRTRVLRERNLEYAVLDRTDLRKADMTGAFLRGASLREARLQGASLRGARLQGASLRGARLQGADLRSAQLQGAWLEDAQMQGADLGQAQMQGVRLEDTQLQGARLDLARMQGAWLDGTQLQGASLWGTQLQGAMLIEAQLQGARLIGARIDGSWIEHAWAWRLVADRTDTSDSPVSNVVFNSHAPCAAWNLVDDSCQRKGSWEHLIEVWLGMIPEGDARERARLRFSLLLAPSPDPPVTAETESNWRQTTQPDAAKVAKRLGEIACDEDRQPYIKDAPYVARGILRQVTARPDLGPQRAILAARLADPYSCPGARGLTDTERARLAAIAAGRDD